MAQTKDIIIFSCCSVNHQIIFRKINGFDNAVFVHIYLANYRNFLKRLWVGLKYAFGYKSKYGVFDEFMLDESNVDKLEKVIKIIKGKG